MSPETKRRVGSSLFYTIYTAIAVFVALCFVPAVHFFRHNTLWVIWAVVGLSAVQEKFGGSSRGKFFLSLVFALIAIGFWIPTLGSGLGLLAAIPLFLFFAGLLIVLLIHKPNTSTAQPQ